MKYFSMFYKILIVLFLVSCTEADNTDGSVESSTAPDLATYLEENPNLKSSLKIEQTYPTASYYYSGSPVELSYDDWSDSDKEALNTAFRRSWYYIYDAYDPNYTGTADFTMPLACTNCAADLASNPASTPLHRISEASGKSVYMAYAAQSLALEIGEGLSWSVATASTNELHHYFNTRSLMHRLGYESTDFFIGNWSVEASVPEKYLGHGSPATPIYIYSFFTSNDIIANTHEQTIYNLAEWFRNNAVHFYFGYEMQNMVDHWQFPGQVPASRLIAGTVRDGESESRHWTAGCHGTASFFMTALKAINIPVEIHKVCGHAVMYFPSVGLYMDHGDNPYNANVRTQPTKPVSGIFIDESTFTSRFGSNAHLTPSSDGNCANIGKAAQDF